MEKQKEYCENLYNKYKELEEKKVLLQDYIRGEDMKETLSPEEKIELDEIKRKLKDECLEFLSPQEKFEIEK